MRIPRSVSSLIMIVLSQLNWIHRIHSVPTVVYMHADNNAREKTSSWWDFKFLLPVSKIFNPTYIFGRLITFLFKNLIINLITSHKRISSDLGPSWKYDISVKFLDLYGTKRFNSTFATAWLLHLILRQMKPIHILTQYFHKIHFNSILSFTLRRTNSALRSDSWLVFCTHL